MSRKGEDYLFQITGHVPLLMAMANMLMSSGVFSLTRGVPIYEIGYLVHKCFKPEFASKTTSVSPTSINATSWQVTKMRG